MEAHKTFIDYITWDHLIKEGNLPLDIEEQLKIDIEGGNKLCREYHKVKNGVHYITYKGKTFEIPEKGHEVRDGGNVHTAMISQRVWTAIAQRNGNYIGAINSTLAPVSRDGFWIAIPGHKNPSLGGEYDKEIIAKVIAEEEDRLHSGQIVSELWTPSRNPEVERMIIPSSQTMEELKDGLKQKAAHLCANHDELEALGIDTQSIDWKSEESLKGFVNSFLPEERKNYKTPTLLLGLEIDKKSMGVYGFEGKRIIAVSNIDFNLSDRLVKNIEGLSEPKFLGGRGDTQAGGKGLAENYFSNTEMTVKHSISSALANSFGGSAVVHRRMQPNLRGFETKLDSLYEWSVDPIRQNDFITTYIEY